MTPTNLTENAVPLATTLDPKSAKPAAEAPRPAPKAERHWFVFDRWLPSAPGSEDEFVLA